jgi:hypothetical protein
MKLDTYSGKIEFFDSIHFEYGCLLACRPALARKVKVKWMQGSFRLLLGAGRILSVVSYSGSKCTGDIGLATSLNQLVALNDFRNTHSPKLRVYANFELNSTEQKYRRLKIGLGSWLLCSMLALQAYFRLRKVIMKAYPLSYRLFSDRAFEGFFYYFAFQKIISPDVKCLIVASELSSVTRSAVLVAQVKNIQTISVAHSLVIRHVPTQLSANSYVWCEADRQYLIKNGWNSETVAVTEKWATCRPRTLTKANKKIVVGIGLKGSDSLSVIKKTTEKLRAQNIIVIVRTHPSHTFSKGLSRFINALTAIRGGDLPSYSGSVAIYRSEQSVADFLSSVNIVISEDSSLSYEALYHNVLPLNIGTSLDNYRFAEDGLVKTFEDLDSAVHFCLEMEQAVDPLSRIDSLCRLGRRKFEGKNHE